MLILTKLTSIHVIISGSFFPVGDSTPSEMTTCSLVTSDAIFGHVCAKELMMKYIVVR